MSDEVSNKVLASLLVIAIVVSVVGIFFSLGKLGDLGGITGRQVYNNTESSTSNITILGVVGISVTGIIDFGIGITAETQTITVATFPGYNNTAFGFNNCDTNPVCMGIVVENTGNVNANVSVNFSKTSAEFIGGTVPGLAFNSTNGDTLGNQPGCNDLVNSSFLVQPTPGALKKLCGNLSYIDSADKVTFEMIL